MKVKYVSWIECSCKHPSKEPSGVAIHLNMLTHTKKSIDGNTGSTRNEGLVAWNETEIQGKSIISIPRKGSEWAITSSCTESYAKLHHLNDKQHWWRAYGLEHRESDGRYHPYIFELFHTVQIVTSQCHAVLIDPILSIYIRKHLLPVIFLKDTNGTAKSRQRYASRNRLHTNTEPFH